MKEDEKFKGAGCLATNSALHQWLDRTFDLAFIGKSQIVLSVEFSSCDVNGKSGAEGAFFYSPNNNFASHVSGMHK